MQLIALIRGSVDEILFVVACPLFFGIFLRGLQFDLH